MNALSLAVSLWLAAQSSPAEGVDPFAQPQPSRRAEPAIRLGNPQSSATNEVSDRNEPAPRNPLRAPPANTPAVPQRDPPPADVIVPVQRTIAVAGDVAAAEAEESAPRVTAKDFIAGLLVAPEGEGLAGQPLRLLDALLRSAGRPPADIVRAYWELASATAVYHQRRREAALLETLAGEGRDPAPELTLAQGAARAALVESKVAALTAQQRLRSLVPMAGNAMPTVADVPHTGAYHTYFGEIFRNRPAPADLGLLDSTLPLEKEAVQTRFKAAQAAADHSELGWSLYREGKTSLADALAALAETGRQERAFVQSVTRYNLDIAGYALRVAPAGVPPRTIVGMLIKDPLQRTAGVEFDGQVIPAGATELMEVSEPAQLISPDQVEGRQPTLLPAGEIDGHGRPVIRSTFEPRAKPGQTKQPEPTGQPDFDPRQQEESSAGQPVSGPFQVRKPALAHTPVVADPKEAVFGSLGDTPDKIAGMAQIVFGDAGASGHRVTWNAAISSPHGAAHYWQTAAAFARWKAWDHAARQLAGIRSQIPVDQTSAQLACRAAHLAAQGEVVDARLALIAAQTAWAQSRPRPGSASGALPLPSSAPDVAWMADSAERATPTSPAQALWRAAIKQRAAALLAAEEARLAQVNQLAGPAGVMRLAPVLAAARQQTEATLAFANTLASAQTAVGAGASPEKLQPTPASAPVRSTNASTKSPVSR